MQAADFADFIARRMLAYGWLCACAQRDVQTGKLSVVPMMNMTLLASLSDHQDS